MAACSILEVVIGGAGHHVTEVGPKVTNFLKVGEIHAFRISQFGS